MDFCFTDEQQAIAKMANDFARKELMPGYAHRDRTNEFPKDLWRMMGDLGFLGVLVNTKDGGQGLDHVTLGIIAEELAKGDPNLVVALVVEELVGYLLENYGSKEAKQEWLPLLLQGTQIPALVLTEPHCGTDAAAIRTRAVKRGDRYLLSGEKSAATLMMAADLAVIFAKTDPKAGAKGVSAFLVPTNLPGITRQSYADMGGHCLIRGSIFLDEVAVPEEYLLGKEGEGFSAIMKGFDFSRIILGLACLGAALIALEETIKYVKERSAFGKPLARFEGVSFPLAEHFSLLQAIRWLCYHALWRRDCRLAHGAEAAMCKLLAPEYAVKAIHDCLLLHGHYGYTREFLIEQRLRDVIGIEIADGTAQASKIVITREIFGKEYLPY